MRCLLEYAETKGDRDAIFKRPALVETHAMPTVDRPGLARRARAAGKPGQPARPK